MKGLNLSDCSIYVSSLKERGGWRGVGGGGDGRENEAARERGREADRTGKEEAWLRISRFCLPAGRFSVISPNAFTSHSGQNQQICTFCTMGSV